MPVMRRDRLLRPWSCALSGDASVGDPRGSERRRYSLDRTGVISVSMSATVIVWDLETVPDLVGFAAANDLVGKSDVEVREAIGDKFPKHIYHSIICIGALIAHWELDH